MVGDVEESVLYMGDDHWEVWYCSNTTLPTIHTYWYCSNTYCYSEFAYSTKGNYGGLFDPNIGRLGEGVGKVAADRSRDEEGKGAGEKTRPTPWCTQPLTLDYFDKKMAKESIGKMRGARIEPGTSCFKVLEKS